MLKKLGLHHGGSLLVLIWGAYYINPLLGLAFSLLGIGWFGGKEYQEWKQRGSMEWPDFITPLVFAVISMYFINIEINLI